MSRSLLLIAASVLVLTVVASGSASAANEPIVIGTANSLTGVLAPFELAINGGMEVAADEINAAGGVAGRKIKIIHVDAKSDLNLSATAALDVIEKGAQIVVPICDADLGAPGARAANEKGVLGDHLRGRTRHRQADGRPTDVQHLHGLTDGERDQRRIRVPHAGLAPRIFPLRSRARVHEGRVRGVQDALEEPRREGRG